MAPEPCTAQPVLPEEGEQAVALAAGRPRAAPATWASSFQAAIAAAVTKSGEATPGWERIRFTWATRSASPATKPLR